MGEQNYDKVLEWFEDHKQNIVDSIRETFDTYDSNYVYYRLSSDDDIEVCNIIDCEAHLCCVELKICIESGELNRDQDGDLWPDERRDKGFLKMYLDIDADEGYAISFDTDSNGKIDLNAAFSLEEPEDD